MDSALIPILFGRPAWGPNIHGAYTLPTPVLLDAFDADSGYALVGAAASKVLDTTHKVQGTGSIQVTGDASSSQTAGLDKTYGSVDPTALGTLAFYWERATPASVQQIALALHRGAITSNVNFINESNYLTGGRWLASDISLWPTVQAAGVGALRTRELISQVTPNGAQGRVDALYYNAKGRPTVVLTFDDVTAEVYSNVYPLMAARGFVGSCTVPTTFVGNVNRMTLAQLQELYAAGWDMFCNSTDDSAFTSMADTATALADVNTVRTYLQTNGMPRAKNHWCWPNGTISQAIADAFLGDGFLAGRTTNPQLFFDRFGLPPGVAASLPSQGAATTTTLATLTAQLDAAKLHGQTLFCHFHDIKPTPSAIGWQTDKFTSFLDALKTAWNANLIDVLTVSQWYARASAGAPGV